MGCRTRRPAPELVRIAVVDGRPVADRRAPGRGAWLCPDSACLDLAVRRRALSRALRADLDPDDVEDLRTRFPPDSPFVKR